MALYEVIRSSKSSKAEVDVHLFLSVICLIIFSQLSSSSIIVGSLTFVVDSLLSVSKDNVNVFITKVI